MHNYIEGQWRESSATETLAVVNPATGEELGRTPLSPAAEVDQAAQAAARAFPQWRRVPVTDRVQFLFRLKTLLEDQFEDLARTITMEAGKTLAESRGELRRAIENVEVACGAPILMQGYNSEDIAAGIDEMMIRQPLGVTRDHLAIQLPGDDPVLVPSLFDRGGQHRRHQTLGAGADDDAEGVQAAGWPEAAGRGREPGQRQPRRGQCDPRPSDHPIRQLRRVERDGAPRLLARRGGWQARAVPGWREEPGDRHGRRRHVVGVGNHRRQRVRLRRPALPRVVFRDHRGRGVPRPSARRSSSVPRPA